MRSLLLLLLLTIVHTNIRAQSSQVISAANADWKLITEFTAFFDRDYVAISISGVERFTGLYYRIVNGGVDLKSMKVYFENGEMQDFAINESVKPQANSRIFDLVGEARKINKIVLKYAVLAHTDDRAARLELWGSQTKRIR